MRRAMMAATILLAACGPQVHHLPPLTQEQWEAQQRARAAGIQIELLEAQQMGLYLMAALVAADCDHPDVRRQAFLTREAIEHRLAAIRRMDPARERFVLDEADSAMRRITATPRQASCPAYLPTLREGEAFARSGRG